MTDVRTARLEDVATDFAAGPFGSDVSSKNFRESGVPMLRGSNLATDVGTRLDEGTLVYLEDDALDRFSRSVANPGDLIFTSWGTIGQIGLIDARAKHSQYIVSNKQMKLTPIGREVSPLYLYYNLSQPDMIQLVQDQAIGSSVPGFNLGQLRRLQIRIHSPGEQRAIADVLGALDDKIAANGDLAENCEALAQHLARRTSVLSPLRDLVSHRKSTVTPAEIPDPQVSHYSLPAYDDGTGPEQVAPATIKSNKYEIQTPAVLVSRLNPRFPRFWNVASLDGSPALASTEFMVLEPIRGLSSVLWAALSQPSFSAALQGKVAGTSGSHQRVRPADLLETPVIDTREIDDHEAEAITTLVARGDAARNESLTLAATRDALLPALMSGKLRVKDAERQVEAVV